MGPHLVPDGEPACHAHTGRDRGHLPSTPGTCLHASAFGPRGATDMAGQSPHQRAQAGRTAQTGPTPPVRTWGTGRGADSTGRSGAHRLRAPSQFENRSRRVASPGCLSCVALPDTTPKVHESETTTGPGYPEGNFGGNQLLDGSIGLSPLCPIQTTQFARQDSYRPPPQFPTASS